MTAEHWLKVEEHFNRAVELSPAEREKWLAAIEDASLRREVEELLDAEQSGNRHLAEAIEFAAENLIHDQPQQIGAYKIIRELGFGGMGAVFLATREDLGTQVALKIIKRGMDTDDILRRFDNERRILAALEHPNIARLIDGGTTHDGLPFFVMEYVEGADLITFCKRENSSIADRLALFRKICAAVSYAHSRLVVHRDLKPSNILVTKDGEPKLLDFGISKLLAPERGAQTVTATNQRLMTPAYSSPEQVRGEQITTASDIYSLGVLLYELLTGCRPYQIKNNNSADVIRAVCETAPPAPSRAIADLGLQIADLKLTKPDGNKTTGKSPEKTNPKSQIPNPKLLAGDLDNITLMALRKDPENRYSSVEQFSEDLRRHLEGLPVTARPLTFVYRASKFVRRNRLAVGLASFLLMSLIGFAAVESWQSIRLTRERNRANVERERAEKISAFLTEIFRGANPAEARGKELTARELLDRGAVRVRNEFDDQPEIKAKLLLTMAESYQALSVFEKAEELGDEAVRLYRQIYGDEAAETLKALDLLADVKFWNKKHDEALAMQTEVVRLRRKIFGENFETAKSISQLAFLQRDTGAVSRDTIEDNHREALAMARRALPPNDARLQPLLIEAATSLGNVQYNYAEAEGLCRETIALAKIRAAENPLDLGLAYSCLGRILSWQEGRSDEAVVNLERVLEIRQRVYQGDNQFLSNAMCNLGGVYFELGKFDKSEPLHQECLAMRRRINSPMVAQTVGIMGIVRYKQGKFSEAETFFQEAFKNGSPHIGITNAYAALLIDKGELTKAEKMLRESLAAQSETSGEKHPMYADCLELLGKCLLRQKRFSEAETVLRQNYEIKLKILGDGSQNTKKAFDLLQLAVNKQAAIN